MKSVLVVIGTRPEAIKMAPVLSVMQNSKLLRSKICITRQHTDLLDPFLLGLNSGADYLFEADEMGSSLHQSAACILRQFGPILEDSKPDLVMVQGDTTTAFTAALAAFYAHIPIAHIEAGLRTGRLDSPWPEEAHRCLIDRLADYLFAPTEESKETLLSEGIPLKKIWVVGNTSIDAIRLVLQSNPHPLSFTLPTVVVTIHRRENQGEPLVKICQALRHLAEMFSSVRFIFLLHPNPQICGPASEMLAGLTNIDLMKPMEHPSFIQLLSQSLFVITDSGGIQEEASFMGKPLIIIREKTERPEGVRSGAARLVSTKSSEIIACCKELLENDSELRTMAKVHFPYGDGYAAEKIVTILEEELAKDL